METYHEQKKRENYFLTLPAIEDSRFYKAGWHVTSEKNAVNEKTLTCLIHI